MAIEADFTLFDDDVSPVHTACQSVLHDPHAESSTVQFLVVGWLAAGAAGDERYAAPCLSVVALR